MSPKTNSVRVFSVLLLLLLASGAALLPARAEPTTGRSVKAGVRLLNVERVDLAANSYRLDFYIWFDWDPADFTAEQIKAFEFLNGAPSKEVVYESPEGFIQYRVRGDFVKTFDFTRYPFESQKLSVTIEHKSMNSTELVYTADPDSSLDAGVNIIGWSLKQFKTSVTEHKFSGNSMSNFGFELEVERPFFSSFVKNVVPLCVITLISLLTFFIAPQNYETRISLAVSTLMAASAFHISLLSSLPPTGYLTLADRMMVTVYIMFLFNLGASVWIMRLVDRKMNEDAAKFNGVAWKVLAVLTAAMVYVQLML